MCRRPSHLVGLVAARHNKRLKHAVQDFGPWGSSPAPLDAAQVTLVNADLQRQVLLTDACSAAEFRDQTWKLKEFLDFHPTQISRPARPRKGVRSDWRIANQPRCPWTPLFSFDEIV